MRSRPTVAKTLSTRARHALHDHLWTPEDTRRQRAGEWVSQQFYAEIDALDAPHLLKRLGAAAGNREIQEMLLSWKNCGKITAREILEFVGVKWDDSIKVPLNFYGYKSG